MYFFFLLLGLLIVSIVLTIVWTDELVFLDILLGITFLIYGGICFSATFSNSESEEYRLKYDGYIYRLSKIDTYGTEEKLKLYKDIYEYNNHVEKCRQVLNGKWFNWAVENAYYDMPLIELREDKQ